MTRKEVNDWLELKVSDSDKMLGDMIKESDDKVLELTGVPSDAFEDVGGRYLSGASFAIAKSQELDEYLDGIKIRLDE